MSVYSLSPRQMDFVESTAFETLYGGAAGGGKSCGQLLDALRVALRYPGSRQLMLRRTFPELARSLLPQAMHLYPADLCRYNAENHEWRFANGSVLEFGHCQAETDVTQYQSAEYDVLRFDELTHFTEEQFTYLISRVRGARACPKQVKSTTNPGGIGHEWVKRRYIDPMPPDTVTDFAGGNRLFLPARLQDNPFLTRADPDYAKRLGLLSEHDRRALLLGQWDLSDGRYFSEWSEALHVVEPFAIPPDWSRVLSIDYGLDMLAGLWIAQAPDGRAVVYREVYETGLIISEAARCLLQAEAPDECIARRLAPPDLWGRRQETGKTAQELFCNCGLYFEKSVNRRVDGWYALHEYLAPTLDKTGACRPRLTVFSTCRNLIRTLPTLRHDVRNPNDVSGTPHELTHAPDALRGWAATVREQAPPHIASRYDCEIGSFLTY